MLRDSDYFSYKINSNNFDNYTNRDYPYVQLSQSNGDRYYGVCPGCGNPILLVNLYKNQVGQVNPYGRHVKKDVPNIANYNQHNYNNCPYSNPNWHTNNTSLNANSLLGLRNKKMLKEQFDRIIYILKIQTGLCFSENLAKKMLNSFVRNKGWLYRWTIPDNLPWKFAESSPAQILNGQFLKLDSDLGKILSQKYHIDKQEEDSDRIQVPVRNNNIGLLKFVFKDFKHKLTNNGQHIEETIRFAVLDVNQNEVFDETLEVEPDFLINLIRKTDTEKYRNKDLLEYAKKSIQ